MISAEVICDSISEQGKRLTTFKLRYPKFIHGEAKTHRVIRATNEGGYFTLDQEVGFMDDPHLSRNASSSRAIPVPKSIEEIRSDNYASPVYWGREQKGMQSGEAFVDEELSFIMMMWREAALSAADHAEKMHRFGAHKSIVNRILEPYLHINVVASATEWENFFGLRLHVDAQPEARALAIAMWNARKVSTPKLLRPGEWHLPYVDFEEDKLEVLKAYSSSSEFFIDPQEIAIRISVARCARVSYKSFETGKRSTVDENLKLYTRLVGAQPLHASPAEHQGTPDNWHPAHDYTDSQQNTCRVPDYWEHQFQHGNFLGFRQYRKMLPDEACAPIPEEFL